MAGRRVGQIQAEEEEEVMPAIPFKSILLHTLPANGRWEVIGISHIGKRRTIIAVLDPPAGEDLARLLAGGAALQLAGQPYYDED